MPLNQFYRPYIKGQRLSHEKIDEIIIKFALCGDNGEASEWCSVARSTIRKYVSATSIPNRGNPHDHATIRNPNVINFVEEISLLHPYLFSREIKQLLLDHIGVQMSLSNLKVLRARLGFRYRSVPQIAIQHRSFRICFLRKCIAEILFELPLEKLIFIDETHFTNEVRTARKAMMRKDQSVTSYNILNDKRYSTIMAIQNGNILLARTFDCSKGAVTSEDFQQFMLDLYKNVEPDSIAVLDNARVHVNEAILKALDECNIVHLFTAPYSPDMNPIELVFGYLKKKCAENRFTLPLLDCIQKVIQEADNEIIMGFIYHCYKHWSLIASN